MATAIIGSAVIGAGAAVYASNKQASAAQNAITAQQNMFNQGLSTAQSVTAPFINAGENALPQLAALTGTGPQGGEGIQKTLEGLPGFQFQKQQGLENTQAGFAAQGLGSSGGAIKGAASFVNGLTSSNLGQYYNMLLGQSELGANSAGGFASSALTGATQTGQGIAQSTQNVGNAQAAGANGVANALQGGVGSYLQYSLLSQLLGKQGTNNSAVGNTNVVPPNKLTGPDLGGGVWPG